MLPLPKAIAARAVSEALPTGSEGMTLAVETVTQLAEEYKMPGCCIEAEALAQKIIPVRYARNMDTITPSGQRHMLESSIGQVGLGGLGGNLLEMFLRAGIGHIRGADGDDFEGSNLNRQALSTPKTLGMPKSKAAALRAQEINPSVRFEPFNKFLAEDTFPGFLDGCHLAVDALGGLASRLPLQQAAADADIPLVSGGLAGWTGFVGVVMPGQIGPASLLGNNNGAEEQLGCPSPAVTLVASIMAAEVVKILDGTGASLAGKMLIIDLAAQSFETITL